jgi:hypothetical protein
MLDMSCLDGDLSAGVCAEPLLLVKTMLKNVRSYHRREVILIEVAGKARCFCKRCLAQAEALRL